MSEDLIENELIQTILSPKRDFTPRTNPHTLREFINGSIHSDFLNELKIRIEDMRDFNEECSSKEYLETRGGIKALRLVAGIFVDMYNNALKDNYEKDEENEDG